MKQGTVKFFNTEKGFGFIHDEESGKDIFVHKTGLIDRIKDNDKVEFEVDKGPKGLFAIDVKKV